jgi:hypothetical protein
VARRILRVTLPGNQQYDYSDKQAYAERAAGVESIGNYRKHSSTSKLGKQRLTLGKIRQIVR